MKKRVWCLILALALLGASASTALGAGGSVADPAVALSYVEGPFTGGMEAAYTAGIHRQLGRAYRENLLAVAGAAAAQRLSDLRAASGTQRRAVGRVVCRQGDVLTLLPGCKATLLSGTAETGGAGLIDVTRGQAAAASSRLAPAALYMAGDAGGTLTIRSAACELTLDGVYRLAPGEGTDYGALAEALSQMGLFRGMSNGFNLEGAASRAQGLVMFLRILGLEREAAAYTGTAPFQDVPRSHWAYQYVAYAYSQGLTAGTSASAFSPESPITCQHYATFLLRALHYGEGDDFSYESAVGDLQKLGLFTQAEMNSLSAGAFCRYKMVYLSFYGLFGVDQESGRLLVNELTRRGAATGAAAAAGVLRACGPRIGG